jgi:hypothetical protein
MRFRPPAHLAWCVTSGQVVFLDIRGDRYSQLGSDLVAPFRQAVAGEAPAEGASADAVARLMADGLLVEIGDDEPPVTPPARRRPKTSLLEAQDARAAWATLSMAPPTFAQVFKTRGRMRRFAFERLLGEVAAYKPLRAGPDPQKAARASVVALGFARWRPFVPVPPVCLLDSLALVDLLYREGLPVDLIFGVALHPFTAHCWVQCDDVVLNDGLDRVLAHTPILVV